MTNDSLWSNVVFEKEVILQRIWFRDLSIRIWGPEFKHLKANNFVFKGAFSLIFISQLRQPIELEFSQVCYFMHNMLRYNKWEDLVFDNYQYVSSVFKWAGVWLIESGKQNSVWFYENSESRSPWWETNYVWRNTINLLLTVFIKNNVFCLLSEKHEHNFKFLQGSTNAHTNLVRDIISFLGV